jgi:hypothetical protein
VAEEENKKEKKKGTCSAILPLSPVTKMTNPNLHNIAVEIKADEELFEPKYLNDTNYVILKANLPSIIRIPFRGTIEIDCGFSVKLPPGFRYVVHPTNEMAAKGVILKESSNKERVCVYLTNIGKEILPFEKGQAFALMTIEPVYFFRR